MFFYIYRFLIRLLTPLVWAVVAWKGLRRGVPWKRIREYRGLGTVLPPMDARVIWVHSVSLGETKMALHLIRELHARHPEIHVVLTTITLTGAEEVARADLSYVTHQFLPFDHPVWVRRFMAVWNPVCGLIMEQELWPVLLTEGHARAIPITLVNAYMPKATQHRWQTMPGLLRRLLPCITQVLAQSAQDAAAWRALGHTEVHMTGNLKFSSPPLSADPEQLAHMRSQVTNRPVWVAASMHAGEESLLAEAHALIKREVADVLTIVVPRHLNKTQLFVDALCAKGATLAMRSQQQAIMADTDVYVADTHGEMGLWYDLCPLTMLGGSLIPGIGGHNPVEPIQLNCAVLTGPYTHNIDDVMTDMAQAQAVRRVDTAFALARTVVGLFRKPIQLRALQQNGHRFVQQLDPLPFVYERISPFLMKEQDGAPTVR